MQPKTSLSSKMSAGFELEEALEVSLYDDLHFS